MLCGSVLVSICMYGSIFRPATADSDYPDPQSLVTRAFHGCREANRKGSNGTIVNGFIRSNMFSQLCHHVQIWVKVVLVDETLSIDFSKSWTNSSVRMQEIHKGNSPLLNYVNLRIDAHEEAIFLFGDELSLRAKKVPSLHSLGSSSQMVKDVEPGHRFNSRPTPTFHLFSLLADYRRYSNGIGYYLGSHLSDKTYPNRD
ncbi:hypothetical protein K469DRAFT_746208 [Zopfia rhizophila CBS 207.26]|uniref:Uncharacterized protein n=1 Tax=Zopfia rhizophila CBS 207.26 TaxID=1314779 RepID=A0A6A6ELE8_9PEZI|nr:hypothetical protein K469DRAFT_746208 [Zopfia rhizophila CBS 207.26]